MDYKQVSKHNSKDSCWVILYNKVYDVTEFLPTHPGGAKTILRLAGKDATESYDPIHPPGTLESSLPAEALLGEIDVSTVPSPPTSVTPAPSAVPQASKIPGQPARPHPASLLNLNDVEAAAQPLLSKKAWAYYYSAADDLLSKSLNNTVYRSILLRPRVFVDCTRCDPSTTLLSKTEAPLATALPLFVSPAAMARLADPSGERGIAQACARYGITQIISNNSSMTPEQIVDGAAEGQTFGWQLYVQTERKKSEDMLKRIVKLPQIKFIVLTLDAPVPGKREDDERSKIEEEGVDEEADPSSWQAAVQSSATVPPTFERVSRPKEGARSGQMSGDAGAEQKTQEKGGLGKFLFAGTAADLTWKTTLAWLAQHTTLPIVLKGIQTHEDAYSASLRAPQVAGIILSNHGGRAADTAPPAIHTLLEIRKYCPEVLRRIDVFVDGGIKRGTDVIKALCLGARAVGVGRAPLYGLSVAGISGVERVFEILREEVETGMRLLGAERVDQLGLRSVNARQVERDIFDGGVGILEGKRLWSKL